MKMKMKRVPATPVLTGLIMASLLVPAAAGINFSHTTHAQSSETSLTASKHSQPQLSTYAVDLTQLAAQGKLEAVVGLDAEINRVIAVLASPNTKADFNGRVSATPQVSDVNSREMRRMLSQNGILLGDTMAKLGAMKVHLPASVIETPGMATYKRYLCGLSWSSVTPALRSSRNAV